VTTLTYTSDTERRSGRLLRILGVGFGIAVGVGATIGGGILRTPGQIAGYMGTAGAPQAGADSAEALQGVVVSVEHGVRACSFCGLPVRSCDWRPQVQPVHGRFRFVELPGFPHDRALRRGSRVPGAARTASIVSTIAGSFRNGVMACGRAAHDLNRNYELAESRHRDQVKRT